MAEENDDKAAAAAAKAERAEKARAKAAKGKEKKRDAIKVEPLPEGYVPRLLSRYNKEIIPALMKEFGYKNAMEVPKITKIVVNAGIGEATANPNLVKTAADQLSDITGQHAVITKSKKAIANFKLREGQAIGATVTLRRMAMWEFLDRLVSVALPRTRDFKGINGKAFDGRGNYTLGLKEQIIFPELSYEDVEKVFGMNISIITTAKDDVQGKALLRHLGMPFRN
ncbi:MAG: 50S ribosomal protein L5 [Myxococcota bacterium]